MTIAEEQPQILVISRQEAVKSLVGVTLANQKPEVRLYHASSYAMATTPVITAPYAAILAEHTIGDQTIDTHIEKLRGKYPSAKILVGVPGNTAPRESAEGLEGDYILGWPFNPDNLVEGLKYLQILEQ